MVKLPQQLHRSDEIERVKESFRTSIAKNLEPDDSIVFMIGDFDVKCFNGQLIELTESERNDLIARLTQ